MQGRWQRIKDSPRPGYSVYRCTCGNEKEVLDNNVRRGLSKSCGCFKTDHLRQRNHRTTTLQRAPTDIERAWAAGFWDGEGCTTTSIDKRVQLRQPRLRIQMGIAQAGEEVPMVLTRFKDAVGGLGHIRGPYWRTGSTKPVYTWAVQGMECCQMVLVLLWPYLSDVKRQQAVERLKAVS